MRKTIWGRGQDPTEQVIRRAEDLTLVEPDQLRDSVRKALSSLSADELVSWRHHLLSGLTEAGLNLGACRFVIGISGESPDSLTPSSIAHLIRYVRLNLPDAMKTVAGRLGKLLLVTNDPVTKGRQSQRAA